MTDAESTGRPRTAYVTAMTLDGFIATDDHSLEWLLSRDIDPAGPFSHDAFMAGVGAIVMGRSTYDWIERHREQTGEAWFYQQPTWVMTHRPLEPPAGADVRAASGDVADLHPRLVAAAAGRDVWVVGGGALAADLARAGLLDEVIVSIAPVTLGSGAPLLDGHAELQLMDSGVNREFLCARYRVLPTAP
ncbi:dihydrofolate reductase family protein [Ruania halotolerans]|uniref:dihydrofolate reductase family protein n=1 Tax=Ruania halotolerans TaxID=2897773 RepID=UPI001E5D1B44|nr:dihydrofolate reductase family protein [Ruania halotolerans]UFU05970.1 dihydrofolate reductase family protein [Ruania halotolerans]